MRGRGARADKPNHKTVLDGRILKREGPVEATDDPAQGRKGPSP